MTVQTSKIGLRASARFDHVIFPLDIATFLHVAAACGFTPAAELPPPPLTGPNVYLGGGGTLARKGTLLVDLNTERQFFGVTGLDPAEVWSELGSLIEGAKGVLDPAKIMFFELQARFRIRPATDPVAAMRESGKGLNLVARVSQVFEQPMALFSAQLSSSGPDTPDYFELWMQPDAPNQSLGVSVVYRNPSPQAFQKFVLELEERISQVARLEFAVAS